MLAQIAQKYWQIKCLSFKKSHFSHGVGLAIWKSSRANTCKTHYKCTQNFYRFDGVIEANASIEFLWLGLALHLIHFIPSISRFCFDFTWCMWTMQCALWHCTLHSTILASTKIRLRFRQGWMYFIALHRFRLNMMFATHTIIKLTFMFSSYLIIKTLWNNFTLHFWPMLLTLSISCWKSGGGGGVQTWCIIYRAENRLKDQKDDFSTEK